MPVCDLIPLPGVYKHSFPKDLLEMPLHSLPEVVLGKRALGKEKKVTA